MTFEYVFLNYISLFITFVAISSSLLKTHDESSRQLVIEEEGEDSRMPKDAGASFSQSYLCSYGTRCVPLGDCQIMTQLLKQSCLQTDKMRGLSCGYRGSELMVCCPETCPVDPPSTTFGQCGVPKVTNWWSQAYRGLGSQPWVVRIGFKNRITDEIEYLCCGSIINKRTILTAAHCALAKTATHKIAAVRVGEYDSSQNPDCLESFCAPPAIDIALNHIIVHPEYDAKKFRHNIALIVLKTLLNYSVSIQPICFYPKSKNYVYVGNRALLVGWGKLAGQIEVSSVQQQLSVPVVPLQRCQSLYGGSVPVDETQLCVGGEAGRDACSGFGGAPLLLLDPMSRAKYYQIGLMSFGSDQCGAEGIPSIYTRLDSYSSWVELNSAKE